MIEPMTLLLTLAVLCMAIPFAADWYLRHLPVAPACPTCRWIARELPVQPIIPAVVPGFARTFLAECGRCGWRGRMRWTFARDAARNRRGV